MTSVSRLRTEVPTDIYKNIVKPYLRSEPDEDVVNIISRYPGEAGCGEPMYEPGQFVYSKRLEGLPL